METYSQSFLASAASPKGTPSPNYKRIIYRRGKPYLDFTYRGRRVRYNLDETLPERCERLGKPIDQEEMNLLYAVVAELGRLDTKTGRSDTSLTPRCNRGLDEGEDNLKLKNVRVC